MTTPSSHPLTKKQMGGLMGFGCLFWYASTRFLDFVIPLGFFDGISRLYNFALIVPLTWACILLACKVLKIPRAQTAMAVIVMCAVGALMDGVSLSFFAELYADSAKEEADAAVTLLWSIGVALSIGIFMSRAQKHAPEKHIHNSSAK